MGLAWRPFGDKFSIRSAFGIYYIFSDFNQEFQKILNPTYYPTVVYGPVSTPILQLDNLFLPPTPDLQGSLFGSTKDPGERRPYMEQARRGNSGTVSTPGPPKSRQHPVGPRFLHLPVVVGVCKPAYARRQVVRLLAHEYLKELEGIIGADPFHGQT